LNSCSPNTKAARWTLKVDYRAGQLERVGLRQYVEFHVGDALETLRRLPGPFEIVLVDLWKDPSKKPIDKLCELKAIWKVSYYRWAAALS
jgi:hypothetical protein